MAVSRAGGSLIPQLDRSERHALAFHALFAAVAVGILAWPVATLGTRIWALVLGYNLALPIAARLLGHREGQFLP